MKITVFIKTNKIGRAGITIIQLVQLNEWREEINQFKNKRPISTSNLLRFKLFLDKIKVGGRLKNAESINIFKKHLIVLSSTSPFTCLVFVNEHKMSMHSGS